MQVRFAALAVLAAATATTALAVDFPARKAGLWTTTVSVNGTKVGANMTSKMCVDPSVDAKMMERGMSMRQGMDASCKPVFAGSGSTRTMDSSCTMHGMATKMHANIVFSGNSSYHMDMNVQAGGDGHAMHMVADAKWAGACPPDMKPGDMDMNGIRINALNPQGGISTPHGHLTKEQIQEMIKAAQAQQQQHQQ
ncbi:MAG TPA: DUF3617 family protein [Rhizomicrobium sp.]|jgi:hypothetical protein